MLGCLLPLKTRSWSERWWKIDARPSDCLALAVRQDASIYVRQNVWDELRDMSEVLAELKDKGGDMPGYVKEEPEDSDNHPDRDGD